ncbi:MAG: hypothetical protein ACRD9S_18445, partial [Pyrinomonadaceae bacterium]
MYTKFTLIATTFLLFAVAPIASAQCLVGNLKPVSEFEKTALVIDVRPDQINQFKGKSDFKKEAKIVLVNMNPFLFSYSLKVDQTEVQDTGFLNFLKLLGSPVSDLIGSVSASSLSESKEANEGGNIGLLIRRTDTAPTEPHSSCDQAQVEDAKKAIAELTLVRKAVLDKLNGPDGSSGVKALITSDADSYKIARAKFRDQKDIIFDSSVEARDLCKAADTLHSDLTAATYPKLETMRKALAEVKEFQSMVEELKSSALEYETEYQGCPARANGLS